MKANIKTIGIDDSSFKKGQKKVRLTGVILRGNSLIEGVHYETITSDGFDSAAKIIRMINRSPHKKQLRAILTQGTTAAGFNLIDTRTVNEKTGIPVISVLEKEPDEKKVESALKKLTRFKKRVEIIKRQGPLYKCSGVYFKAAGITPEKAAEIINVTILKSKAPEPIRIAHLIGREI